VTSSNSKFTVGSKENNSIVVNFNSDTSGTFTSTITVSDNTYNTGKSDSVVLTVNVPEPKKYYYLRYGASNTDNYNNWTNEVEGTELTNGDIVFKPLNLTVNNNYIALTTQPNDTSLSTNINISDFTGSNDGSLQDMSYQEWGGKHEYRLSAVSDGNYTVIFNLTNKTIYVEVYSEDTNVKASTYNIRYYNGEGDPDNEGDKSWLIRRASVYDMIEKHNPDVCGLQEVTPQMTQDIIDNLPDYTYIGYGRVSGDLNPILPISTLVSVNNDEQTGLIYKTSKYTELEKGRFFVSDTPSVPSKYSESIFNRLAVYVKLKDNETGKEFYFLSTHLDHPNNGSTLDELCREKQATALIQNAKGLVGNLPYYIVGDFNSVETEEAYPIITAELNDAYYTVGTENAQGGYNGTNDTYIGLYNPSDATPKRIDFIFTTDNIGVNSYIADNDNMGLTLYPSDHLPVVCDTVIQ
jgi:endonuclease/exonuclease/phosphatase family metal-dependent hydrolase